MNTTDTTTIETNLDASPAAAPNPIQTGGTAANPHSKKKNRGLRTLAIISLATTAITISGFAITPYPPFVRMMGNAWSATTKAVSEVTGKETTHQDHLREASSPDAAFRLEFADFLKRAEELSTFADSLAKEGQAVASMTLEEAREKTGQASTILNHLVNRLSQGGDLFISARAAQGWAEEHRARIQRDDQIPETRKQNLLTRWNSLGQQFTESVSLLTSTKAQLVEALKNIGSHERFMSEVFLVEKGEGLAKAYRDFATETSALAKDITSKLKEGVKGT